MSDSWITPVLSGIGAIAGIALAPETGGLSMLGSAMLGASVGGAIGDTAVAYQNLQQQNKLISEQQKMNDIKTNTSKAQSYRQLNAQLQANMAQNSASGTTSNSPSLQAMNTDISEKYTQNIENLNTANAINDQALLLRKETARNNYYSGLANNAINLGTSAFKLYGANNYGR